MPGFTPLPPGGDPTAGGPPQAPPQQAPPPNDNVSPLTPQTDQTLQPGPTPDQRVAGYMEQIRNLTTQIDALANQFPDAAQTLNTAKLALVKSMENVATAMSQPSGANQPPTF